jgi:undecaprenyl diphosphate synthase
MWQFAFDYPIRSGEVQLSGRPVPCNHQAHPRDLMPRSIRLGLSKSVGIDEVSIYGYTQDNTRRPSAQTKSFRSACVEFAKRVVASNAALVIVGDDGSPLFPDELKPFRRRCGQGVKVNLLANYGWEWDLNGLRSGELRSGEVSQLDMIVRWGGGRRLSGFLPVQSVYGDFFVVDAYWPDFEPDHFARALDWFGRQDRTLGG